MSDPNIYVVEEDKMKKLTDELDEILYKFISPLLPEYNIAQLRTVIIELMEKEITIAKAHQEMETYCAMKKKQMSVEEIVTFLINGRWETRGELAKQIYDEQAKKLTL